MRRTLFLLAFTALVNVSVGAQPKPFFNELRGMDFKVLVQLQEQEGHMVFLAPTDTFSLRTPYFYTLASSYVLHRDSLKQAQFAIGMRDENVRLSIDLDAATFGWIVLAIALCLAPLVLAVRYRRRLRLLHLEQARMLNQRRLVEQGQEQERHRMARDLHDGPLQSLYALRMQLARRTPDLNALDEATERIAEHLRGVTTALRSPLLARFGLAAAIEDLATAYPGMTIVPTIDAEAERLLDERTRNTLFRVAQEATSNAVRHGHATRVTARLVRERQGIRMSIQDNGAGFDARVPAQAYGARGHYGLLGMQERVEVLGGRVHLHSSPAGTKVDLVLPATGPAPGIDQGDGASSRVDVPTFP